LTNINRYWRV